jgi:recombination DNA repair RAD52 pathway protein
MQTSEGLEIVTFTVKVQRSVLILWAKNVSRIHWKFLHEVDKLYCVRFEVFTAVTMKNGVFWDVTPCGSCKNRRFGGT